MGTVNIVSETTSRLVMTAVFVVLVKIQFIVPSDARAHMLLGAS